MCTETLTDLYTPPPHITQANCIECCQVTVWAEAAKGDPQGMYSHKAQQWPWHLGELCQLCQHFSSFARAASCWGTCSVPKKQPGTLEISNTRQTMWFTFKLPSNVQASVISSCISGFHGNSNEKRSPINIQEETTWNNNKSEVIIIHIHNHDHISYIYIYTYIYYVYYMYIILYITCI